MNLRTHVSSGPASRSADIAVDTADANGTIIQSLQGPRPERTARRTVTGVLADLGFAKDTISDAELAVDELVTNATRHAPGGYELRMMISEHYVKVAVADGGNDHDHLAALLAAAAVSNPRVEEDGHGLQLIAGLFPGACGVDQIVAVVNCKQVWIRAVRPMAGSHG